MSKDQSRRERLKNDNQNEQPTNRSTNKAVSKGYYWALGILFFILMLLVFYIFYQSNDKVNLESDNNDSSIVQEDNETEEPVSDDENEADETENNNSDADETSDETDDSSENESTDDENTNDEEIDPGETTVVNEDAPYDSNHAIDFSDGSSDRVAIKNAIISATGLESDLTEWWVGNDGPGRVEATVSNPDQSQIYRVYLQYGDGNWHVMNYERLTSIPSN